MKLQLDASALKWLFENSNEEWKLELQSSVAQAFAARYLKAVVTTEVMSQAKQDLAQVTNALLEEVNRQIAESIGKVKRVDYNKFRLESISLDVRAMIEEIVLEQKEQAVKAVIKQGYGDLTADWVKDCLTSEYKQQIRAAVRLEVLAEIQASLK